MSNFVMNIDFNDLKFTKKQKFRIQIRKKKLDIQLKKKRD